MADDPVERDTAGTPSDAPGAVRAGACAPTPPDAPGQGADVGRRRFFRAFASELIETAAMAAGAAQALQRASAEAASAILDPGLLGVGGA